MLSDLLAGLSGLLLIACGLVPLVRTHGPTLAALSGMSCEIVGAVSAVYAWQGTLPMWAVPAVMAPPPDPPPLVFTSCMKVGRYL